MIMDLSGGCMIRSVVVVFNIMLAIILFALALSEGKDDKVNLEFRVLLWLWSAIHVVNCFLIWR